jgi:sigma-E factor negative regulatory protein RseA
MKAKISALMDGELERHEAPATLAALQNDGDAREAWRTYHLISDALRETRALSADFARRVAERLAEEPTVIGPGRLAPETGLQRARWLVLSAAASIAAAALVGWLAFGPQQGAGPAPQLAQRAAPQLAQTAAPSAPPKEAASVPPPEAANDYLLAHQGYSPRVSLQGMAPYVRLVAGGAETRKP